jgi:hypothetical protein
MTDEIFTQAATKIEEIRLDAFSKISKLVDEFVADHYGDQPQLVQFSLMFEFLEAVGTYSVLAKIDLSIVQSLLSNIYNRYQDELLKEKREN